MELSLQNCFLFSGLSLSEKEQIGSTLSEARSFSKGDMVFPPPPEAASMPSKALGIILSGKVNVHVPGSKVIMNRLNAGDVFGVASLFTDEPYGTVLVSVSSCKVIFLPQAQVVSLMREYPAVTENYLRFLSDRIRFLNRRIAGFTLADADQRVWQRLLDLSNGNGFVKLSGSFAELARSLNMGRSSLYRSFDSLESSGWIRREKKIIYLKES